MQILGSYFKDFELKNNIAFVKKENIIKAQIISEKIKANLFEDPEPLSASLRELK